MRFQALSAAATPGAMQTLVKDYDEAIPEHDALTLVPLAVLDFLCIHLFTDGNGRVFSVFTVLTIFSVC